MCGLVGIVSNNLIHGDKKVFTTLLYLDQLRGKHSTGVCAVNNTKEVAVYKRALEASDYLQLTGCDNVLTHSNRLLMGHNRYATVGAKDDNNSHPFTHGDITLAHNGTLTNKSDVIDKEAKKYFPTDSESITYAMSVEYYQTVLERLEGAYALTWYDKQDNTINFARNEERELYIGYIGTDVVWASEKEMLELAAAHHKKPLKDVELLPVGEHRMFELNKLEEGYVATKFTPKKKIISSYQPPTTHHSRRRGSHQTPSSQSKVNTTLEGWITEVRDSGFIRALTNDYEALTMTVPRDEVPKYKKAFEEGHMVRGVVKSSNRQWEKNVLMVHCHLSCDNLTILDVSDKEGTPEKKCSICLEGGTLQDSLEEHYGNLYHSSCLDDLLDYMGNQ
jgi:predicted glutamine amidotransferase